MGVVRRYIDILTIIINFPYSTCISSFLAAASLLLCSFLKCFFVLAYVIFAQYITNVTQRTFEIVQKNRDHANIIIGVSLSEPHTYRTAVQNPPFIYVPFLRPASNLVLRRAPLNAQRANVGPASNNSKVNNIALKTATLVLRFS